MTAKRAERFWFWFWSILNGVTLKSSYIMLMNCSIDNSNHVLNAKKVEKKKQCTGPRNIEFQWISHVICLSDVGWFWLSQKGGKALLLKKVKRMLYYIWGFVLLPYVLILYNLEVFFNFHFTFLELNVTKIFIVQ